mmetsp:Transcript_23947/g.66937  ORF Transcript_23947/g.66937 Transcript_23947/m.66937 type:complete len:284 (+) Transcript_23947:158-1009(+)
MVERGRTVAPILSHATVLAHHGRARSKDDGDRSVPRSGLLRRRWRSCSVGHRRTRARALLPESASAQSASMPFNEVRHSERRCQQQQQQLRRQRHGRRRPAAIPRCPRWLSQSVCGRSERPHRDEASEAWKTILLSTSHPHSQRPGFGDLSDGGAAGRIGFRCRSRSGTWHHGQDASETGCASAVGVATRHGAVSCEEKQEQEERCGSVVFAIQRVCQDGAQRQSSRGGGCAGTDRTAIAAFGWHDQEHDWKQRRARVNRVLSGLDYDMIEHVHSMYKTCTKQ